MAQTMVQTTAMDGVVPWPAEAAQLYRKAGYWRGEPIGDYFDRSVAQNAERLAIVDGARRVSYRELGLMVERLALGFAARGVASGRRVIFQLPNSLECAAAYFACLKIGAIPVATLPAHRHTEIGHLARFTDAYAWLIPAEYRRFNYVEMAAELRQTLPDMREVFVTGASGSEGFTSLDDLLRDPIEQSARTRTLTGVRPRSDDVAVFQLSGGSTGLPKVIPRTHDDYLYNSLRLAECSGFERDGVALVAIPMMHNFPLLAAVQAGILRGARIVLASSPDAEVVLPLIEGERVTWICAVPAMAMSWLNHPRFKQTDFSSLRSLAVGGQRLNPEPARRILREIGPVVTQVYGMAEGLCCSTRRGDAEEAVVSTQGRPICEHDELRIVGDDDREVAPGEIGELLCRGPYTPRGYYRAAEHNRIAFTPDGFYRTGDLVRMHPSGNVIVEGRRKDVINRGGEKISAEEVEDLVLSHPAVLNASVVAMPDAILGERACAYVVLRPGAHLTFAELTRHLEERRIARFKIPERLEIVERFPMTAVGKISKKDLRADIAARLKCESSAPVTEAGGARPRRAP
ncbi:MAG TPA: AMP-binding protein [Candidatus Binataceae bacterium]|nr:AMP-binding protein [Candidatus Binataceae bacterium]